MIEIANNPKDHFLSNSSFHSASSPRLSQLVITLLYRTKTSHLSGSNKTSDNDSCLQLRNISTTNLSPTNVASGFHINSNPQTYSSSHSYISSDCLADFKRTIQSIAYGDPSCINGLGDPTNLTTTHRYLDDPIKPLAIEIILTPAPTSEFPNYNDMRKNYQLCQFTSRWNVDVAFQRETVFRRYPRLVCFDMDSTLIEEELIDVIAESIGVEAEVSAITKRAMNGELDFFDSLKARCKLLKGTKEDVFVNLRNVVTPTRGLRDLLKGLKRMGVCTAIFSGGFLPFVSWFSKEFGIDYAFANSLSVADGHLTGALEGDIVDAKRKQELLYEIARKEGIGLDQVVAVGDGANDIPMLNAAGLGVAWNAKPLVQELAQARLNSNSLLDLLYFFGLSSEEVETLIS